MKNLELKIYGRVQGVFFRQSTQLKARELGLAGWVTNNEDGTVSLEAEGQESSLKNFFEWCKKGPVSAKVEKVEERWSDQTKGFQGFEFRKG